MTICDDKLSDFIKFNNLGDSLLVLDSTGPSVTKHYHILASIGMENLRSFKRVDSFSGGTFAYLGFLAVMSNQIARPIEHYFLSFDSEFRKAHHHKRLSVLRCVLSLLRSKSLMFGDEAINNVLELIFSKEFLKVPKGKLDSNFNPFLSERGGNLVAARQVEEIATVKDLLMASIRVPIFYGLTDNHKYYDAAFSPNYKQKLLEYRKCQERVLCSTPWRSGVKSNVTYIKCTKSKHPEREMMLDFARLALNISNKNYNKDLKKAFG